MVVSSGPHISAILGAFLGMKSAPPNKKQAVKRVVKKPLVSTIGLDTRKLADLVPQTQPESFSDLALDRRVPVQNMVAVDQRRGIINVMVQSRLDEIDDKLRNYMRTAKLGAASGEDVLFNAPRVSSLDDTNFANEARVLESSLGTAQIVVYSYFQ